jgi:hypothetical protein
MSTIIVLVRQEDTHGRSLGVSECNLFKGKDANADVFKGLKHTLEDVRYLPAI